VAALARAQGALSVCDNTFASPINQQPLALGVDLVVHSATKYLGGHHDITAGAVVASRALIDQLWPTQICLGATLGPMDAWLLLRGLRTLALRVRQHNASALALAAWLESHPKVERVFYPGLASHPQHALAQAQMRGFGGVMNVMLRGGYESASRFVQALKLPRQAVSLGGVESLVVHAAAMWAGTMNDEQMRVAGIAPNAVRFSVGDARCRPRGLGEHRGRRRGDRLPRHAQRRGGAGPAPASRSLSFRRWRGLPANPGRGRARGRTAA
jgi:cystathionine beta-lyase/cystathionine gamma-synthase